PDIHRDPTRGARDPEVPPRRAVVARLLALTELGVVVRRSSPSGGGWGCSLSRAGAELFEVCVALGTWGSRWLELAPEHLDPYIALWSMARSFERGRLPARRLVIRFEFPDQRRHRRFWLLVEQGQAEVCVRHPGDEESLVIEADSEAFVRIRTTGPRELVRAFISCGPLSR